VASQPSQRKLDEKQNKLSLKFKAQMAKDDFHTEDAKMDKPSEHLRGDHP
jgi:hypothetical protein